MDVSFWKGIVLQICRSEPAAWDGMITISLLYENPRHRAHGFAPLWKETSLEAATDANHRQALKWYSRSLSRMQTQIHRGTADVQVALISCILFICIETLQGNMAAAYALYQQGVNLITELQSARQDSATSSVQPLALGETIAPVFFRLGTVAHITSGYPLDLSMVKVDENPGFSSLLDARNVLIKLVAECMHFERLAERHLREVGPAHVEESFRSRKRLLETKLKAWRQSFDGLDQVGKTERPRPRFA
jgi:hypothetical protein